MTNGNAVKLMAHMSKIRLDPIPTDITHTADFVRICQNNYVIFHVAYVLFHTTLALRTLTTVQHMRSKTRHVYLWYRSLHCTLYKDRPT